MSISINRKLTDCVARLVNEMEEIGDLDIDDYQLGFYHATRALMTKWLTELQLADGEGE